MQVRKAVARVARGIGNAFALFAFFLEGDADPLVDTDEEDDNGPAAGPAPAVTLSSEARRMVAEGAAPEPVKRPARPHTAGVFANHTSSHPPLKGSAAARVQGKG